MKKDYIYIVLFVLAEGFIINSAVLNLLQDVETGGITGSGYFLIFYMILSFIFIINNYKVIYKANKIINAALIYGLIALFLNTLHFKENFSDFVRVSNSIFQWVFSLIIGYILAFKSEKNKNLTIILFLIMVLPISLYNIYIYSFKNIFDSQTTTVLDVTFILLVIIPFVLTLKQNVIKIILVIFIGLVSFMSFKRTTILSYVLMISFYYIYSLFNSGSNTKNRKKIFALTLVLIGGFVLIQLFNYIEGASGDYITERLQNIGNDRGSERLDIYSKIFEIFSDSSIWNVLLGNGYMSVREKIDILAHNDFLEVLFDFGIIAFAAYLVFFIRLIKYSLVIHRDRRKLPIEGSASFVAAIILFLFLGFFNCFITSPIYFATLMFYFGLEMGSIDRIKKTQIY